MSCLEQIKSSNHYVQKEFLISPNANNTYAADFDCTDITNKEVGESLQETNQSGNSSFM